MALSLISLLFQITPFFLFPNRYCHHDFLNSPEKYFAEENTQKTNKHMQRHSTSFLNWENSNKNHSDIVLYTKGAKIQKD